MKSLVKLPALIVVAMLAVAACKKSGSKEEHVPSPAPKEASAHAGHDVPGAATGSGPGVAAAPGPGDCATLAGANAVQTEMRRLECALQHAIAAIGRDDLPSIGRWIHVVHSARMETEKALESGVYKPAGDLQAFVALDQTFHGELEQLVEAAAAKDHAGASAALGRALGACQGCHATFRPVAPTAAAPAAAAPAAAAPAAPVHEH